MSGNQSITSENCSSWSSWSELSGCSQTCGNGTKAFRSTCLDNETVSRSNTDITRLMQVACNNFTCPTWTSWNESSSCSEFCEQGVRTFTSLCEFNGISSTLCEESNGSQTRTKQCNTSCESTITNSWSESEISSCNCNNEFPTLYVVLGVVGFLLLIAAVVTIYIICKKRKNSSITKEKETNMILSKRKTVTWITDTNDTVCPNTDDKKLTKPSNSNEDGNVSDFSESADDVNSEPESVCRIPDDETVTCTDVTYDTVCPNTDEKTMTKPSSSNADCNISDFTEPADDVNSEPESVYGIPDDETLESDLAESKIYYQIANELKTTKPMQSTGVSISQQDGDLYRDVKKNSDVENFEPNENENVSNFNESDDDVNSEPESFYGIPDNEDSPQESFTKSNQVDMVPE